MNIFEQIKDYEKQPLSQISYTMIKWLGYDNVDIYFSVRGNVESTVWIIITVSKDDKKWYLEGQRLDIVKTRLINFLNQRNEP